MVDDVKKEKLKGFYVGEVATQTQPVIINAESSEQYDLYAAVAAMWNELRAMSAKVD